MDTNRRQLEEMERAAAAPFITAPRTQSWYPLLMAGFFTVMAAGPVLVGRGHAAAGFGLQVVLMLAVGAFYVTYRETWGTRPRMRSAPREIASAYRWCFVAFAVCVVLSAAAWTLLDWRFGLGAIFATTLVATWAYERVLYPTAARRVRDRLG